MNKPLRIGRSYAAAVSPDGSRLASLGWSVFVWDIANRKKLFRCHPFTHPSHVCFSPSGAHFAVKSTSGHIVILSSDDGHTVKNFENKAEGEGSKVAYSACGNYIVDGSWKGWLRVRETFSGAIVFEQHFPNEMLCAIHCDRTGQKWFVSITPRYDQWRSWFLPHISPFGDGRSGNKYLRYFPAESRNCALQQ